MRKLFWYIYTRLRLWYLYRGGEISYCDRPEYYKCPTCNWEADENYWNDNIFLGASNEYYCGSEGYRSWTEHWKCPRCGTEFEFDTSN